MTTISEIPLTPQPQAFNVALGDTTYRLRFGVANVEEGGWFMDIGDPVSGAFIVCGIPLVTGVDLLAPYAYLGIGGALFVVTAGIPAQVPGYADLGVTSKLYYVAP